MTSLAAPDLSQAEPARSESAGCDPAERALDLGLPAPHPDLQSCIVVPVRNEEAELPHLLASLSAQVDLRGRPAKAVQCEVILLLNNCTDASAQVARRWHHSTHFHLHVAEVELACHEAHVGRARQIVFDAAYMRFRQLGHPGGLILTTDADTRLAPDWAAAMHAEIEAGADAVGGRIQIKPEERAALSPSVQRLFLLDIGYRRALEQMRHLYAPDAHDSFPRHHQHFGGSMAVTAEIYGRAHGMPLAPTSEDVALYRAILACGGRFRHSYRVRAFTSARTAGRAFGGLADAMAWWQQKASAHSEVKVESARHAQYRLKSLGQWRWHHEGEPPRWMVTTPEPPPEGEAVELHTTLRELRERNAYLQMLSLEERLSLFP